MIERAKGDLARQLGIGTSQITVVEVEAIEWPNSGLGCPQPGMMYAQVITPGHRIVLETEGRTYEYHTDQRQTAILCSQENQESTTTQDALPTKEPDTRAQPAVQVNTSPLLSPLATPEPRREHDTTPAPPTESAGKERQPPYDEPRAPPPPAEMARRDLARRLRVRRDLVSVVQIEFREPDADRMPCLAQDSVAKELGDSPQVQWISLSYRGKPYHYVAVRESVLYCEP
jgi:hypothetical protein